MSSSCEYTCWQPLPTMHKLNVYRQHQLCWRARSSQAVGDAMLIISTPNLSRCRGSWHHRENPVATTPGPYTHGEGTTQTHTNEDKKSSTLLRGAHKCGARTSAGKGTGPQEQPGDASERVAASVTVHGMLP